MVADGETEPVVGDAEALGEGLGTALGEGDGAAALGSGATDDEGADETVLPVVQPAMTPPQTRRPTARRMRFTPSA